jgi:hypothetical protein
MTEGLNKLKRAWNDNPLAVIAVGALTMRSAARLLDALSGIQSKRAYAKSRRR